VGAGRVDGKELLATARDEHQSLPHVSHQHAAIGNILLGDADLQIWTYRLLCLTHGDALDAVSLQTAHASCGA
jgi:hypothetical protein